MPGAIHTVPSQSLQCSLSEGATYLYSSQDPLDNLPPFVSVSPPFSEGKIGIPVSRR